MEGIKFIKNHAKELQKYKTAIVRSSLNVPLKNGKVADNFRILRALDTIKFLDKLGLRVLIISHIGRKPEESFEPVYHELKKYIFQLRFARNFAEAKKLLKKSNIVLLENLRSFEGETENSIEFAKTLASLGEIFVQDAFSVCHREHASMVSLPKFLPSYAGLLFQQELEHLEFVKTPKKPALFVLGGAKFATKEQTLKKIVSEFDDVVVVGAIANDLAKARGLEVGRSLVSGHVDKALAENKKILLPEKVLVLKEKATKFKKIQEVEKYESIVDAFLPEKIKNKIKNNHYKTIVWNGPFGFYEGEFTKGTYEFLKQLKFAKNACKIAGGGDSVRVIRFFGMEDVFDFVSTAGGAMLEYIVQEEKIPCIKVLKNL